MGVPWADWSVVSKDGLTAGLTAGLWDQHWVAYLALLKAGWMAERLAGQMAFDLV